jgi:hypothetical protein
MIVIVGLVVIVGGVLGSVFLTLMAMRGSIVAPLKHDIAALRDEVEQLREKVERLKRGSSATGWTAFLGADERSTRGRFDGPIDGIKEL